MQNFGFNVRKFGKSSGINLNSEKYAKGGVKKEQVDAKYHSIFNKVDADKNGILDNSEMASFKSQIDKNQSGYIDKKEAKDFLYNNNDELTYVDEKGKTKELTGADLNSFLAEYMSNPDMENIKVAEKVQIDGEDAVQITNNDGSQNIIFNDKEIPMQTITTDAETGSVTTTYTKDDICQKTKVVEQNGNMTETEFAQDGTTPLKKTSISQETGSQEVISYNESGIPAEKDVVKGSKTQHYEYDETGQKEYLLQEVENKGHDVLEKTTTYSYAEDGTVKENITQADGKNIVRETRDGNVLSETISTPGQQVSKEYDENGKLKTEITIKGESPENYNTKNVVIYNEDGGRTEVFTQPSKNYVQTNEYNAEGFKLSETSEVNGQTYRAKFDGKGHGTLTLKAGETLEAFSKRTGVSLSEIKANNKFPGGVPQAGQSIVVPDKYVKATDSNNYAVSASAEKSKGNAAEQNRIAAEQRRAATERNENNTLGKLNQVYVQNGTKGKYKSYDEYAKKLLQNEGISPITDQLVSKTAKQISGMNGNKPISSLNSIKCPVSAAYKQRLEAATMSPDDKARVAGNKGYISGKYTAYNYYEGQGALRGEVHYTFKTPTKPAGPVTYNSKVRACYVYTDTKGIMWESQTNSPNTKWRVAGNAKDIKKEEASISTVGDPNGSFGERFKYKNSKNNALKTTDARMYKDVLGGINSQSEAYSTLIAAGEALVETIYEEVIDDYKKT